MGQLHQEFKDELTLVEHQRSIIKEDYQAEKVANLETNLLSMVLKASCIPKKIRQITIQQTRYSANRRILCQR